jgi:hypothetical protein
VASPIPLLAPVMATTMSLILDMKFSFAVLCDMGPVVSSPGGADRVKHPALHLSFNL